ncbi:insecticidal delta-endotoxin Cry8Ea1 family protein [Streptomyces sp. FIT100]|uniref:insecticidal delta-endotoxin Cry8Ea1 family protein n=1 Tax=Streptomyces sp. FIT100 TaxID=2837956 RepID=UPI0021CAE01E|nr:insecticidal delta-endotoxin Cry8Ea1 family protein [Streptomyces sp. FIT100]UUN26081.1 hypothetical protein KK483_06310 [Streptomyces sp. FIT100]
MTEDANKKLADWEQKQVKLYHDTTKAAFGIGKKGLNVKWDDPYQVIDFSSSVVSAIVGMIPVFGPACSSILDFFSAVFTMTDRKNTDVWPKIAERVKALVKGELDKYHLESIEAGRNGVLTALTNFQTAVDARNSDQIKIYLPLADQQLVNLINKTTQGTAAVQALPAFAALADVRLALLVSAIKNESEWGIGGPIADNCRRAYDRATKVGTSVARGSQDDDALRQAVIDELQGIVENGDVSRSALEAAVNFISDLQNPKPQPDDVDGHGEYSYVEYARKVYWKGYIDTLENGTPKNGPDQYGWWREPSGSGGKEWEMDYYGFQCTMISQYESLMRVAVVQKALMWPYMLSGKIPSDVRAELNRPLRYHFGRMRKEDTTFQLERPTPAQIASEWTLAYRWPRPAPIAWLMVWWTGEVNGLVYWRTQGSRWEGGGRDDEYTARESVLSAIDESDYFTSVGVVRNASYPKLGSICFQRASDELKNLESDGNPDSAGWAKDNDGRDSFGTNTYQGQWSYVKLGTGWQLSDITVPVVSGHLPKGAEGITLWFQPVINYEKDPD